MASFNRSRFPPPSFGGGYSRNEFQNNYGMRDGPPMMRNYNEGGPALFQRYPGQGMPFQSRPQFPGSDRMPGPAPFRPRPLLGLGNDRMPLSGPGMFRQPFGGSDFYQNAGPPRIRYPNPKERFYVPWNQRPNPSFRPRLPVRNNHRQPSSEQKAAAKPAESRPKKKKNKKKKYNPRPREDAKKLKPWMTDEIYDEVRKKNELYVKAKNEDKPELWQEFKLLRNRVSSMIKDAKLKGGFMTRKLKEDDDVDKPFSCDNCDRAFATETELEEHKKEHIQCGRDGCTFEAHPKVIELHRKMLHDTGYAEAIFKLQSSEEVTKWRNERKRRFPTSENIEKRKAEQAERVARGEVLETEQFGKFKRRKYNSCGNSRFQRQRGRWRGSRGPRRWSGRALGPGPRCHDAQQQSTMAIDSDSDDDSHITIPCFPGISLAENCSPCSPLQTIPASTSQQSSDKVTDSIVASHDQSVLPCHRYNSSSELESIRTSAEDVEKQSAVPIFKPSQTIEIIVNKIESDSLCYSVSDEKIATISVSECDSSKTTDVDCSLSKEIKAESDDGPSVEPVLKLDVTKPADNGSNFNNESECDSDDGPSVEPILKSSFNELVDDSPTLLDKVHSNPDDDGPSVEPILKSDANEEVVDSSGFCGEVNGTGSEKNVAVKFHGGGRRPWHSRGRGRGRGFNNRGFEDRRYGSEAFEYNPFDHSPIEAKIQSYFPKPPLPVGLKKHNLLDKLLANEIRHERNAILQCVRYTVQNNFFDKKMNASCK